MCTAFDNGSRIIAFSANPQAMAVYGGDVGLDEFAKHPNARLLWETAQGRVTWGYDLAIWSSHDGEDTVFNEFAPRVRFPVPERPRRFFEDLRYPSLLLRRQVFGIHLRPRALLPRVVPRARCRHQVKPAEDVFRGGEPVEDLGLELLESAARDDADREALEEGHQGLCHRGIHG